MDNTVMDLIITAVQIFIIVILFDLKGIFRNIIETIKYSTIGSEAELTLRIARIVAQFRKAEETEKAKLAVNNQSASDIIKEITNALEILTEEKTVDMKIIISNDKVNQGSFAISVSYRLDDPM